MENSTNKKNELLKGALLFRNVLWSLGGKVLPIAVALFAIPVLIGKLGDARFGLLSIIWVIIGFASFLDLGLGRAAVKFISEKIGLNKEEDIPGIFGVAWLIILCIGSLLGVMLFFCDELLVQQVFEIEEHLHEQARLSVIYTAIALPFVFSNSVFSAVFKAYQEFKTLAWIQGSNSILNYLAPLLVLVYTDQFSVVIASLVFLKVATFAVYLGILVTVRKNLFHFDFSKIKKSVKPLLLFGGWASVSNVVSPLLDYFDRFLIASVITVAAVTYYATPLDILVKISAIFVSVVTVLFPAISNAVVHDKKRSGQLMRGGMEATACFSFPILLFIAFFSFEILELWINTELAAESMMVLQVFCVGYYLKSLTYIPYAFLHGFNKPDIAAKIHLFELAVYAIILYLLASAYGILGAAIAHSARLFMDYLLMSIYADRQFSGNKNFQKFYGMAFLSAGAITLSFLVESFEIRLMLFPVIVVIFALVMWKYQLSGEVKGFFKSPTIFR
ncbi:flippase [Gracilimonas sp.]|uniref:flippase n=1 Tax=Gracilimonas sp. TaxID=1974203 RepID=UPI002872951F|nr:flippase [Gracilimonas sp.]